MADMGMIAIVVVFYGLCAAYVSLCDRVIGRAPVSADHDHRSITRNDQQIEVAA
jgi:hypothetical protein